MQNYEAQGEIVKGKQQSVRIYCGNLQNNTDVLRSNFAGNGFPTDAVVGQHCFREDLGLEYIYESDGWHECGDNSSVASELYAARGSHDSLKARLDTALNEDGTLKAGAEINMNEWKSSLCTPSYIDEDRFSTPNDTTAMFTNGRAMLLKSDDDNTLVYVAGADYLEDENITIVTVSEGNVPVGIKSVDISIIQYAMPNTALSTDRLNEVINTHNHADGKSAKIPTNGIEDNAITTDKIANNSITGAKIADGTITAKKLDPKVLGSSATAPETTGFTPHVASGMGIEIDGKTGKPVVTAGRCYVGDKYADLVEAQVVNEQNFRGLVYSDKDDDGNVIVGTMPFENPKDTDYITNIPAEDVLFMTDYAIDENNQPDQLIRDLSGNGYNLGVAGESSKNEVVNPLGWKVPASPMVGNSYWQGAIDGLKLFKANGPFSVMHFFIPRAGTSDYYPLYINMKIGSTDKSFYFQLDGYNPRSNTYRATMTTNWINIGTHDDGAKEPANILGPTWVEANKPCLLVFEHTGVMYKFYINGTLACWGRVTTAITSCDKATLAINYGKNNTMGHDIPLFTCIRENYWGEEEIATFANRIGVPNEHVGYDISLPTLYHGIEGGSFDSGYHAWDLDEDTGTTAFDVNTSNPMHGTLNLCTRVNTPVKENPSLLMNGNGYISFGSYALPDNFSFFTCLTVHADGTIASNRQTSEGFIFSVQSGKLSLTVSGTTPRTDLGDIGYAGPVVVGFIKEGLRFRVFADSTSSRDFLATQSTALSQEAPFVLGQHSAGSGRIKATYHKALLADHALSDSEIRAVFRAFKHRSFKKVNDDMGLTQNPVIGMIKTDEDGVLEQAETYPRWGRKKNPFGNQKYFLGWVLMEAGAGVYQIPNYYGSSRVRLNLYAQTDKNDVVMKTLPSEMFAISYKFDVSVSGTMKCGASGSSHTITSKGTTPSLTPIALGNNFLTSNFINIQAAHALSLIGKINSTLKSTTNVPKRAYIGLELEPIADEDNDNNYDF